MNEVFLFVFGIFVTLLAVGPLAYAAYLDVSKKDTDKQSDGS
jgi:hypothetical protein